MTRFVQGGAGGVDSFWQKKMAAIYAIDGGQLFWLTYVKLYENNFI